MGEHVLTNPLLVSLLNRLHTLSSGQMNEATILELELVDRQEVAAIRDHYRRLDMLIHSVGALADIVSENLSRDHTIQGLHVGRPDITCVEGPHIVHREAGAFDCHHGRGDSLLHSQVDLEGLRRISLVALVASLVG